MRSEASRRARSRARRRARKQGRSQPTRPGLGHGPGAYHQSSARSGKLTTPNRGPHSKPQRLGDDVLLDLGGSSVDRRDHRAAQVALHRVLARVSVAAHDLHSLERAALRELGRSELRHRRLLGQHAPRILVGQPCDPADQEPRAREIGGHVGELVLGRLEAPDRPSELLALLGVGERVVERALREPERRGGQDHALVVEAGHQLRPTAALDAEERRLRHTHAVEVKLIRLLAAERLDRSDREALGVVRHEDHRHALVRVAGALGAADDQRVARLVRVRAPHLGAVEHPLAVLAARRRLQRRDVRARVRLRHRDRERAALSHAPEQVALLLLGAEAIQRTGHDQSHVVAADRQAPVGALLEEERRVEEGAAGAAVLLVDRQAVPAELAHLARQLVRVHVLEAVRQVREAIAGELALGEVANRADEVLLLVGQRRVGLTRDGGGRHQAGCAADARSAGPPYSASDGSFAQRLSSRSAMTILWTSSGPSARRSMRRLRHMIASGVSSETPSAPWTWMARSSTSITTFAATTFVIEIAWRASRLPYSSICQAAFSTIRREPSISMRDFAMKSCTNCFSASLPPNDSRVSARLHINSSARSAAPMARMQWWIRPGPRRSCATLKPLPRSPSRLPAGTRQFS